MKKLNVVHIDTRRESYGWEDEAVNLEEALCTMQDRNAWLEELDVGIEELLKMFAKNEQLLRELNEDGVAP